MIQQLPALVKVRVRYKELIDGDFRGQVSRKQRVSVNANQRFLTWLE